MKRFVTVMPVLVLLGVALVIINGCKQAATPNAPGAPTATATTPAPSAAGGVTLAADEAACPVMGTVMKKSEMIPVTYKGKTYYMCCKPCVSKFNADPEKYIAHPATPKRGM